MKHLSKLALLLAFVPLFTEAQDIHFSQLNQAPQLINPATTGIYRGYQRLTLNHRNQWTSLGSPFQTFGAAYDMPIKSNKTRKKGYVGLGVNVFQDKAGDAKFGTTQFGLSFSGIIPVARNQKVSAGIQVGAAQRSAQIQNLTFGSQFNGVEFTSDPSGEIDVLSSFVYADLAAGVYYQMQNTQKKFRSKDIQSFDFGVSYYHANRPQLRFLNAETENLFGKIIVHSSLRKDFNNTKLGIVPFVAYIRQGPNTESHIGALLRIKLSEESRYTDLVNESSLSFGAQVRLGDAVIPQVKLEFGDFIFGLSYDYNTSNLDVASNGNGAFELSFSWVNVRRGLLSTSKSGGGKSRL